MMYTNTNSGSLDKCLLSNYYVQSTELKTLWEVNKGESDIILAMKLVSC